MNLLEQLVLVSRRIHCAALVPLIESPSRSNACRLSPVAKYTAVTVCIDTGSFMVSMKNAWEKTS
jgi:hypothetical protein